MGPEHILSVTRDWHIEAIALVPSKKATTVLPQAMTAPRHCLEKRWPVVDDPIVGLVVVNGVAFILCVMFEYVW